MATSEETKSWQKFLSPLVAAVIALCGAGAAYLKAGDDTKASEDKVVERIIKVETELQNTQFRVGKLERDSELLRGTLSEMKSDLSFIRGKMEGNK